jgi:hypothetical protein
MVKKPQSGTAGESTYVEEEGPRMGNEALLGRVVDPPYGRLVGWLKKIAEASGHGRVTHETALASGRYIVSEEWPSKAAYIEFLRCRETLEAMLITHQEAARDADPAD